MSTFIDAKKREWSLEITFADLLRVKADTKTDLGALIKKDGGKKAFDPLAELLSDTPRLVAVVFCLIQEQADKAGVTPEDFGRALNGDALEAMGDAFYDAFLDFCPSRLRAPLRKAAMRVKEVQDLANHRDLESLDKPTEELLEMFQKSLANGSTVSFGASPESLD